MQNEGIKGKKSRGRPSLSPTVKRVITQYALEKQDTPRKALSVELKKLIVEMGEVPPVLEYIERLISEARNHASSFEDSPWQLGVLHDHKYEIDYSIPADALQIILEIQKNIYKNITVRQVKWLTRIYKVLKVQPIPQFVRNNQNNYWYYFNCYIWASMYADRERVADISGTSCDTSDLDSGLLEDVFSIPLRPINLDSATIYLDYNDKLLQLFMGASSTQLDEKQKEELGKESAQGWERALTGHSLRDFSEHESPGVGLAWLLYASFLISAIKMGIFYRRSQDESEVIILKLREKLPDFYKAYEQGFKSFLEAAPNIWDSIKP